MKVTFHLLPSPVPERWFWVLFDESGILQWGKDVHGPSLWNEHWNEYHVDNLMADLGSDIAEGISDLDLPASTEALRVYVESELEKLYFERHAQ